MAKKRITSVLEDAAKDPTVRALAASTAVAGSALAGKLVHDHAERVQRQAQRAYRLAADERPDDGIKRVMAGQLDEAIELLSEVGAADSTEAVHDARKALKRSRAALRLSRHLLGTKLYRAENGALRDAGLGLSDLRDSQALLETLDGVAPPGQFTRLHDALSARATAGAHNGRAAEHQVESVLPELRRARTRVDGWSLKADGGTERLGPGLERIYRRGRRALRAARNDPSVENLHELRKRAKDLWHAAQLLAERRPKRAQTLALRAHRVSDLLGEEHDLAILAQRVAGEPGTLEPAEQGLLRELIERRRKHLRRQGLSCAERLYRRKPRKLRRRLALA